MLTQSVVLTDQSHLDQTIPKEADAFDDFSVEAKLQQLRQGKRGTIRDDFGIQRVSMRRSQTAHKRRLSQWA